jgi:hypothetical protein
MWMLLAGACGLLRLAINDSLVLTAVKGSAPSTPLRPLVLGSEVLYNSIAELCLGWSWHSPPPVVPSSCSVPCRW